MKLRERLEINIYSPVMYAVCKLFHRRHRYVVNDWWYCLKCGRSSQDCQKCRWYNSFGCIVYFSPLPQPHEQAWGCLNYRQKGSR